MNNVLITGGSSLLAYNWVLAREKKEKIYILLNSKIISIPNTISIKSNLNNIKNIREIIKKHKIKYCIHTAGLADVELCEQRPNLAYDVNVKLSENVAKACDKENIKLIHISTDHLYNGEKSLVDESHKLDPQNVYGKTKAEAEKRVSEICPSSLIVRTNFFGHSTIYKKTISDRIINSYHQKKEILLFSDVYFSPILGSKLANITHELVDKDATGVFNIVSNERISKYEFGLSLFKIFNFDNNFIKKGSFSDVKGLVLRPKDMSLSNNKLCSFLGHGIESLDAQLRDYKNKYTTLNT